MANQRCRDSIVFALARRRDRRALDGVYLSSALKPRYHVVAGLRMPLGFPAEAVRSALTYEPAADDLFVASYPKAGTTWLQYIVHLLVRREPLGPGTSLAAAFPHLEEAGAPAVAALPRPRLIQTHLRYEHVPRSAGARYIAIARNPFDTVVSFFHHTRGFPRHYDFAAGTLGEYFACFLAGEVDFGDYFDHLESWLDRDSDRGVLWLTYEALRRDPVAEIARIARFIGRDVPPDELAFVASETRLESMRRDPARWSSPRPDWAAPFVRTGRVGGWRSALTGPQTAALLAKLEKRPAASRIAGIWPDVIAEARSRVRVARAE